MPPAVSMPCVGMNTSAMNMTKASTRKTMPAALMGSVPNDEPYQQHDSAHHAGEDRAGVDELPGNAQRAKADQREGDVWVC